MCKVTIVMSTYNGEQYLREQLDSILQGSHQDIFLMISDDGSTDGTMKILREYETQFSDKIKVHQNQKNLGPTKNFLRSASKADTDYIMFCDQDDVWKKRKIEHTLTKMKQMENQYGKQYPIAVFTDAEVVDQELHTIEKSFFASGRLNPRKRDLPHLLMENKLIGCTVMFNRSLQRILKEKPLPNHARLHDWWVGLIAAACGQVGYLEESTLLYRQHSNNVVGNQDFQGYVLRRVKTLSSQKKVLLQCQEQAKEFLALYCDIIPKHQREKIRIFANLNQRNPIIRKASVLRHGYLKSGLIRNIGLIIII